MFRTIVMTVQLILYSLFLINYALYALAIEPSDQQTLIQQNDKQFAQLSNQSIYEIDFAPIILSLEKEIFPDLEIDRFQNRIDRMADDIKQKFTPDMSIKEKVKTISQYLFVDQKFSIDQGNPRTEYTFGLTSLLYNRFGNCAEFSRLYLALSHDLEVPMQIALVHFPLTALVAFPKGDSYLFIDTRKEGVISTHPENYSKDDNSGYTLLDVKQTLGLLYFEMGVDRYRLPQWDNAITYFKKSIQWYPDFASAHSNLCSAFEKTNQLNLAILHGNKSLELQPENPYVIYHFAHLLMNQNKYQEAIGYFKKSLEHDFFKSNILNNLGYCYEKSGDINTAIEYYEKAIETNPNHYQSKQNLLFLYEKQSMHNKVIQLYEKYKNYAWHYYAYRIICTAYIHEHGFDKTIALYNQTFRDSVWDLQFHFWFASELYKNENQKAAVAVLQRILEIEPQNGRALNILKHWGENTDSPK
jgi:tetratricopeptide (TPR) repeat protein